jgi:hypothetical protein
MQMNEAAAAAALRLYFHIIYPFNCVHASSSRQRGNNKRAALLA